MVLFSPRLVPKIRIEPIDSVAVSRTKGKKNEPALDFGVESQRLSTTELE